MTAFTYCCRGSAGIKRSKRSGAHDRLARAAVAAGFDIDVALSDPPQWKDTPLVERPQGFALDQKLTAGDVIVISFCDLLTFADEELVTDDDEPLGRAIDILTDWQRRKVRVIIAESTHVPEEQLAAMIKLMAGTQAAWRRERGTAPTG
jgi:hypothetical protein